MEAQLDYEFKLSEVQGMKRFVITAKILHESERAILLGWNRRQTVWIPKSQMKLSSESTKDIQVIWLSEQWLSKKDRDAAWRTHEETIHSIANHHKGFGHKTNSNE